MLNSVLMRIAFCRGVALTGLRTTRPWWVDYVLARVLFMIRLFSVVFVSAWEETKTCPACLACPDAKAFSATSFEA